MGLSQALLATHDQANSILVICQLSPIDMISYFKSIYPYYHTDVTAVVAYATLRMQKYF